MKYYCYIINKGFPPDDGRLVSTDDPKDIEREAAYYGLENIRIFTGEIDPWDFAEQFPTVFKGPVTPRIKRDA